MIFLFIVRILALIILLSLLFSPLSHASELIFEEDPDETSVIQQDEEKQQGYEQLFEEKLEEIEGLKEVLVPLSQDLASLDTQLKFLALQKERVLFRDEQIKNKLRILSEYDDRLSIQQELLRLEKKGLAAQFEKLIVLMFRLKRMMLSEDGKLNVVRFFIGPSNMMFRDLLLSSLQKQLISFTSQLLSRQLQFRLLQTDLSKIREHLTLAQEQTVASLSVLEEQTQFEKLLQEEKKEEQRFFEKALEEAKEDRLILNKRIEEVAGFLRPSDYLGFGLETMIWPVQALLGISAYFDDKDYEQRFGFQHGAVDIPTEQLTPVRAALSGKVLKIVDGGQTGYSYLQLGHRASFSTVYGHLYEFKVEEGQMVSQGDIIALSGGAFGTKGAGKLTTGPHLHFEVLKNGIRMDPLYYLKK